MPIRNQDFYDLNESRPWPLSDEATAIDDAGNRLPSRFLADLHIAFPLTAGRRAMLSALTVTKTLLTVTILATESPTSPSTFVPLAAISLTKPIDLHRQYALDSLFPGAGGWIVFGSAAADRTATAEEYNGRFTLPSQSILLPSVARAYTPPPLTNMAKLGNDTQLTGLIRLVAGSDLEIVKECREVPANPVPAGAPACDPDIAQVRDVIVIRLKETPPTGTTTRNIFDEYKGPCGGRPESNSCGDPAPIEQLASVPPDCCGNIDIRLRGCATVTKIIQEAVVDRNTNLTLSSKVACGIVIDCGIGLSDACITADRLPTADGTLPNEFTDLCETVISITLPDPPPDPPEESISFTVIEESESLGFDPTIPFCEDFDTVNSDLVIKNGDFIYVDLGGGDSVYSTESDEGQALRNVSVWNFNFDTYYKRVSARIQLRPASAGNLHNGAVVANYHETSPGSGKFQYYLAEIDWDSSVNGFKLFRIAFFDGTNFSTEFAVPVPDLALLEFYDICFSVFKNESVEDGAYLFAQLEGVTNPGINVSIGPLAENNYAPSTGKFGMASNRAATRFIQFCVENTSDPSTIGCSNEPPAGFNSGPPPLL